MLLPSKQLLQINMNYEQPQRQVEKDKIKEKKYRCLLPFYEAGLLQKTSTFLLKRDSYVTKIFQAEIFVLTFFKLQQKS